MFYTAIWELRAFDCMGCPQGQKSDPCIKEVLVEIRL